MKSKIYKLFYPVMCNYLLNCINLNQYPSKLQTIFFIDIVWANFALGSNSVKGKDRPNILYE